MRRVDAKTADKIHEILMLCRSKGGDPVTMMDRAGLLSHPSRRRAEQIQFVENLIDSIRNISPALITPNRMPRTPLDLKQYVIGLLEELREGLIKNGTEEQ